MEVYINQKVNVTGNQLLTESDFTLTAGTFTIQIACASTITFSALTGITWEINGYFGGETLNPGWTDTWRNVPQHFQQVQFLNCNYSANS